MNLTIQQQIAQELDKRLLEALITGEIVEDENGNPVLDADGQPLRKPPSARILSEARQRCRDLGLTKMIDDDDPIAEMAKKFGLDAKVLKLPPLDDRPDAATA